MKIDYRIYFKIPMADTPGKGRNIRERFASTRCTRYFDKEYKFPLILLKIIDYSL